MPWGSCPRVPGMGDAREVQVVAPPPCPTTLCVCVGGDVYLTPYLVCKDLHVARAADERTGPHNLGGRHYAEYRCTCKNNLLKVT